jgi:enoyl-CoA hydratase
MEMILTGNHYKADVALAFGLINHLCATGEAYNEARKMLLTILSRAPKAVSAAIKAIKASEQGVREGLTVEADLFGQLCGSMDFREGIAAFSEKRRPVFTGS